jgi:hypothetical protein
MGEENPPPFFEADVLKNYIVDADLEKYYPNLSEFLWTGKVSYQAQIQEAFEFVCDEIRHRGIELRKFGTPLDLLRPEGTTTDQNVLASRTDTATYTSQYIIGQDSFTRLVIDVSSLSAQTGFAFTLQGSNDVNVNASSPPTHWTDILTLKPFQVGVISGTFTDEYKYYRFVTVQTGASISYTISLVDTTVERLVVWQSFRIIFEDFTREEGDIWFQRAKTAEDRYQKHLQVTRFFVDEDGDNRVTEKDVLTHMSARMGR